MFSCRYTKTSSTGKVRSSEPSSYHSKYQARSSSALSDQSSQPTTGVQRSASSSSQGSYSNPRSTTPTSGDNMNPSPNQNKTYSRTGSNQPVSLPPRYNNTCSNLVFPVAFPLYLPIIVCFLCYVWSHVLMQRKTLHFGALLIPLFNFHFLVADSASRISPAVIATAAIKEIIIDTMKQVSPSVSDIT